MHSMLCYLLFDYQRSAETGFRSGLTIHSDGVNDEVEQDFVPTRFVEKKWAALRAARWERMKHSYASRVLRVSPFNM